MAVEHPRCGTSERYKDGRCKHCGRLRSLAVYRKDPERCKARAREWKNKNRDKARAHGRKWDHADWQPGEHERAEVARAIATECAVCFSKEPRHKKGWNADHDHATGLFRAIVCYPCNIAIGHVEKFGLDRGVQIAAYLARYKGHDED